MQHLQAVRARIAGQPWQQVHLKKGREELVWTVVEGSDPMLPSQERSRIGLCGINLHHLPKDMCLALMFLHLTFPGYNHKLDKMITGITTENSEAAMWVKLFTLPEVLMGLGLLIGSSGFGEKGKMLWL